MSMLDGLPDPRLLLASRLVQDSIADTMNKVERKMVERETSRLKYTTAEEATVDGDLGLITAGEFRTGNGVEPGSGFTGVRIGYPGFTYNSEDWNIVGVSSDSLQVGIRASDGKLLAGGGDVYLDSEGATIKTGVGTTNYLKFYNAVNGFRAANIYCDIADGGTYDAGVLRITAEQENVASNASAVIQLIAKKAAANLVFEITNLAFAFTSSNTGAADHPPLLLGERSSAPSTPASGYLNVYAKNDGKLYTKNDAGTETDLSSSGIATVKENGLSVVTSADTLDFKDSNVEDLTGGDAAVYLDLPAICQGRLTLTTAVPVTTSDVTAATTMYFTPYKGSQVSLYDGTRWKKFAFTERSIAVPSTTDTMYDVFLYDNAGTLTLELTAWTDDTNRATALVLQDGVYVKSGATTRRYLGSMRTTGVSGQTEDSEANRLISNLYNPVTKTLKKLESTSSWSYNSATIRALNNSTANRVTYVSGLLRDVVHLDLKIFSSSAGNVTWYVGIGVDSTSFNNAQTYLGNLSGRSLSNVWCFALYDSPTLVGYHYLQAVESGSVSNAPTFYTTLGAVGLLGWIDGR